MTPSSRDLLLDVFSNNIYDQIPVWFMRQAGRYLPEYQKIRSKYTFEERAQTPEIAAEITLQPIRRFNIDAAIIFSDILIPIYAMERGLKIVPQKGPVIKNPISIPDEVEDLIIPKAEDDFPYLAESIELVREEIPSKGLIGFSGAPFTLASYLIEGMSTKLALSTKSFAIQYPDSFEKLMNSLSNIILDQLQAQIKSGVDFVQIFDSWAGYLTPQQYKNWSFPYLKDLVSTSIRKVPVIYYSRGTIHILPVAKELPVDGFSIDGTLSLIGARNLIDDNRVIQGNFDPAYLLTTPEHVKQEIQQFLEGNKSYIKKNYIFNLSSGINKESNVNSVEAMVNSVKNYKW